MHLPNTPLTLIQKKDGHLLQQTTTLPTLLAQSDKGLIIYFYPKDNTKGCTTQACELSQMPPTGYTIIGISKDGPSSHERFIDQHQLTIALACDPEGVLCQHFDVIHPKTLYGKSYLGLVRSSFVFNKEGKLIYEWRNHRAKGVSVALRRALDAL